MKKYLGMEFGSTRIKAVLIDENGAVKCSGSYEWENSLKDGYWTYDTSEVIKGMQGSYSELAGEYAEKYGEPLTQIDAIGVSAMMHGYLAFDGKDNLLVPFRTWRNTSTRRAAEELSEALDFNMPQRWSAVHYYQAVLDGEKHVREVERLHTLASYVHYLLSGENAIGAGDASGMFPLSGGDYDGDRIKKYNAMLKAHGVDKDLYELLPKVMLAGENAGTLTEKGAKLLDGSGMLKAGAPMCPPEGDAGTGMVATNSVTEHTGNVSAGTSAFAMIVLSEPLGKAYPQIDVVTTPDAKPVAMVHVNNCTSEINAWINMFGEAAELMGAKFDRSKLFEKLFAESSKSDGDVGGFAGYGFLSGEPIADIETGMPLVMRSPDGSPTLANFMQMLIYSSLASLALGMKIFADEKVTIKEICGHGGFFKTEFVGQNAMSAALSAPVTVMKNAGEGGAWGIALLALYMANKTGSLQEFLQNIFRDAEKITVTATDEEKKKFASFMSRFVSGLAVERAAGKSN